MWFRAPLHGDKRIEELVCKKKKRESKSCRFGFGIGLPFLIRLEHQSFWYDRLIGRPKEHLWFDVPTLGLTLQNSLDLEKRDNSGPSFINGLACGRKSPITWPESVDPRERPEKVSRERKRQKKGYKKKKRNQKDKRQEMWKQHKKRMRIKSLNKYIHTDQRMNEISNDKIEGKYHKKRKEKKRQEIKTRQQTETRRIWRNVINCRKRQ